MSRMRHAPFPPLLKSWKWNPASKPDVNYNTCTKSEKEDANIEEFVDGKLGEATNSVLVNENDEAFIGDDNSVIFKL